MATISRFVPEEDGVNPRPPAWPVSTRKAMTLLLNADGARLPIDLLHLSGRSLAKLEAGESEDFPDHTWAFTSRFASRAFDAKVRQALRTGGWEVADFTLGKGRRRERS